jgi:hypothetical protein
MSKLTTITIQTSSILVLQSSSSRRAWCPVCGTEREMITLDPNTVTTDLSWPALEQWLKQHGIHCSQAADGTSWLCFDALLTRVRNTNTGIRLMGR